MEPLQQIFQSACRDVTPVRLKLLLLANCLGAVLFLLVSLGTVQQHLHAVQTVGEDAAPSVIDAHEIKIGVLKMDADLADELLYPSGQQEGQESAQDFDKCRVEVGKQLVAAARNITYGAAEQTPIETIQTALGQYEMQAHHVRA